MSPRRRSGFSSPSEPIHKLISDLGTIPIGMRQELRPKLRRAAQSIANDAKQRASWSSRIPGAITITTRLSKRSQGVAIRVRAAKAPHARAYEGIGNRGNTFRHPVFGNRNVWVSQKTRPFLWPAAQAGQGRAVQAVSQALNAAASRRGFR